MNIQYILILKIFRKYINKIIVTASGNVELYINVKYLFLMLNFLKKSLLFKMESLVDINVVDWPAMLHRFLIYYNLLSYRYNYRIFIYFFLKSIDGKNYVVDTVSNLFKSAIWLEREIWDLYGIYFYLHPDLRRILTDYGFKGFPFRKDYPLTGYTEMRYDDTLKIIVCENLHMAQEYRVFDFINPWVKN